MQHVTNASDLPRSDLIARLLLKDFREIKTVGREDGDGWHFYGGYGV
jgi:hypothetical protein